MFPLCGKSVVKFAPAKFVRLLRLRDVLMLGNFLKANVGASPPITCCMGRGGKAPSPWDGRAGGENGRCQKQTGRGRGKGRPISNRQTGRRHCGIAPHFRPKKEEFRAVSNYGRSFPLKIRRILPTLLSASSGNLVIEIIAFCSNNVTRFLQVRRNTLAEYLMQLFVSVARIHHFSMFLLPD